MAIWSCACVVGTVAFDGEVVELFLRVERLHTDGENQGETGSTHDAERPPQHCPQSVGHVAGNGNQWHISLYKN